jgi:hypothetical protein
MGHDQIFEFIDIFNKYHIQKVSGDYSLLDMNRFVGESKTYLHLAVEQNNKQIVSYLLFDCKVDPNKLTCESQMGALHIAVRLKLYEIIELLVSC